MVLYCFQSFPGIHEIQLKHHASFVNDSEKSAATPSTPFISHAHSSPGYPPVSVIVSWKLVASQMQNSTSKKLVILVTRMQQQSQIRGKKTLGITPRCCSLSNLHNIGTCILRRPFNPEPFFSHPLPFFPPQSHPVGW